MNLPAISASWDRATELAGERHDVDHMLRERIEIEAELARREALRAMCWAIPDPVEFAEYMPLAIAELLDEAWLVHSCWRISKASAPHLRPYGLCEYGGPFLTGFGIKVLHAFREHYR